MTKRLDHYGIIPLLEVQGPNLPRKYDIPEVTRKEIASSAVYMLPRFHGTYLFIAGSTISYYWRFSEGHIAPSIYELLYLLLSEVWSRFSNSADSVRKGACMLSFAGFLVTSMLPPLLPFCTW